MRTSSTASPSLRSTPPTIPDDVIAQTRARYVQAYETISGRSFADWWGAK